MKSPQFNPAPAYGGPSFTVSIQLVDYDGYSLYQASHYMYFQEVSQDLILVT